MSISNCNLQTASAALFSSMSTVSSPAGEDTGLENSSFTVGASKGNLSLAHTMTAAPSATSRTELRSNSSSTQGDECLLQDAYCSLQGPGHSLDGLRNECLL